jgi:type IV secretory pathway VirB3-like protein
MIVPPDGVNLQRRSTCNVDLGFARRQSAINVTEARNKPLKTLELIIITRARAHERAAHFFTYIYVTLAIMATVFTVLISTSSAMLLVIHSLGLIIVNIVFGSSSAFITFILTKFALEGRAGRHRERSKSYRSLVNKLRYEKYVTPEDMWGNLYLEVYRDYSNIEREGNLAVPEFLAPKSDNGESDGSVCTVLPISPVPLVMGGGSANISDNYRFPSDRSQYRLRLNDTMRTLRHTETQLEQSPQLPPQLPKRLRKLDTTNIGSSDSSSEHNVKHVDIALRDILMSQNSTDIRKLFGKLKKNNGMLKRASTGGLANMV